MAFSNKLSVLQVAVIWLMLCQLGDGVVVEPQAPNCSAVLKAGGMSDDFDSAIAHHLHWLTVEDLKMFDDRFTEQNGLPTVNVMLKSEPAILANAPSSHGDSQFVNRGMRIIDQVLSHMDDPNYDAKGFGALERIAHAFHMQEIYEKSRRAYSELQKSVHPDSKFCACATDLEANGVMRMLRTTALRLREPELFMNLPLTKKDDGQTYALFGYVHALTLESPKIGQNRNSTVEDQTYIPLIRSAAIWSQWGKWMAVPDVHSRDFALFLQCIVNP